MISVADGVSFEFVERLQADAEELLRVRGDGRELSIRLTNDEEIRRLNLIYRQLDKATDVLSFEMDPPLLGDIAVSLETAERQAQERRHDLYTEVRVLLVHGFCHLLGHDHHSEPEAQRMAAEERALLAVLGAAHDGLVGWATSGDVR